MHPATASSGSFRSLVTGATGFVGSYLTQALLDRGDEVLGLSLFPNWPPAWQHLTPRAPVIAADLTDAPALEGIVREFRPTHVWHLAGYAQVGASFREPDAAWAGNLTATRRLCEAIDRSGFRPRILFVGSGLIYGAPLDASQVFDEDTPLCPDTPYAVSKAAADLAAFQYTCSPGLDIVRARPFNHTGPYQSGDFAIPNFARQLVAIERGKQVPTLEVGDLTPRRDLCDVRDIVAAYLLLLERGRKGEAYNLASGQTWTMQEVLDRMIALTGLKVELKQRADLLRPTEPLAMRVSTAKICQETGWTLRYSLEQTLADTIEAWRKLP
ncbi:MAG: GDP-mannose 4,6-dehydratase [Gemmataceae bacterium]